MATNDDLLQELQNISFMMGDLNAIRNGEYDPPRGADPRSNRVRATPDDIYHRLGTVISLLERQNELIYKLGEFVAEDPERWERANR